MDALDSNIESTVTETPVEVVEAPVKETSLLDGVKETASKVLNTSKNGESTPAAGTEAEWKPNFKVKAYDKEYEIPENFRKLINKENEKEFKDTFEKAFALDVMKEKNAKIRESNDNFQKQIEKDFAPKLQRYGKLESYLQKGDFDSFIEKVGDAQLELKLQQWMLKKLQLRDLPADQQALYNDQRAAQARAEKLEEENLQYKNDFEKLNQSQQQLAVDNQLKELDTIVSSPEIAEIAKSFDTRLGQDGSFKLEVLRRAAMVAKQTGHEPTVKEAVEDYLRVNGLKAQVTQAAESEPQVQKKLPTLPSMPGKASSPAVQKVKSLDDLKKIAKRMQTEASRSSRE